MTKSEELKIQQQALQAIVKKLKHRCPNLTAEEVIIIGYDILVEVLIAYENTPMIYEVKIDHVGKI